MADWETAHASAFETARRRDLLEWADANPGSLVNAIRAKRMPEEQTFRFLDLARQKQEISRYIPGHEDDWQQPLPREAPAEKDPGDIRAMGRGVARGFLGLGAEVGGVTAWAGQKIGSTMTQEAGETAAAFWTQQAEKFKATSGKQLHGDQGWDLSALVSPRWWEEGVAEAIPGMAAFLIPSMGASRMVMLGGQALRLSAPALARLAWIGAKVAPSAGAGIAFGAQELGSVWNEVKARGGTDEEASTMAGQAGLVGIALGAANLHYILGEGGGLVKRFFRGGLSTSIVNFVAGGARSGIEGDGIVEGLVQSLNSAPIQFAMGGGAAMMLGSGGKPAKAAEKPQEGAQETPKGPGATPKPPADTPAPPPPPPDPLAKVPEIDRLRQEHEAWVKAGKPPQEVVARETDPVRAVHTDAEGRATPGMMMPAAEGAPEPGAKVSAFVTHSMEQGLADLGYSRQAINAMPPEEANRILTAQERTGNAPTPPLTIDPARTVTPGEAKMAGEPGPPKTVEFQPDVGAPKMVPAEEVKAADHLPGFANVPGGPEGPYARAFRALQANEEFEADRLVQKRGTRPHDVTQAAADKLRQERKITLRDILAWEPGTIKNADEIRAAVDIALSARDYANQLREDALRNGMDQTAANSAQVMADAIALQVTGVASELGRGLESLKMVGVPAETGLTFSLMGGKPDFSGKWTPERIAEVVKKIEEDNGGAHATLQQMQMLKNQRQREGLGSLRARVGGAGFEMFMAWLFSPFTAAKVVASAFVTAGASIAVTGTAEVGHRIVNAIAPEHVDAIRGTQAGATMNKLEAFVHGLHYAWSAIGRYHDGLAKVYRVEGVVKTEQQAQAILREAVPQYGVATRKWNTKSRMASSQFPGLQGMPFGDAVGRAIDLIGAASRAPSTDLLGAAHGFAFAMHDAMGAYSKAAEMVDRQGLTGPKRTAAINELLEQRPPEVNKAGMDAGKYNTFLSGFEGEAGKFLTPFQNVWSRLLIAPVVGFPLRAMLYGAEFMPGLQHFIPKMKADFAAGGAAKEAYFAKMALGWSLFAVGTALANAGILNGKRPKGVLGDVWDAEEKQEYSINLGGTQISFRNVEPAGQILGTIANFATAARELVNEDDFWDQAAVAMLAVGHTVGDIPVMQGLGRWLDAARSDDPNAGAKLLQQQLSAPIPMGGTLGVVARYVDPVHRAAHGWSERVLQRTPGYSDALPAHRNIITDEPLLHEGIFGPGSSSFIATHTMRDDVVLKELERLRGAGLQRLPDHLGGASPQDIQRQGGGAPGVRLSEVQRERLGTIMRKEVTPGGRNLHAALTDLVARAQYRGASDEGKRAMIHEVWGRYRNAAEDRLLVEDKTLGGGVRAAQREREIRRAPTAQQEGMRARLPAMLD